MRLPAAASIFYVADSGANETQIMNAKSSARQEATVKGYYNYNENYVMQRISTSVGGFYRNEDTDDLYVINCYHYTYSFD